LQKRIISICILLLIIAIGLFQRDVLLEVVKHGGSWSIIVSMILVAICVFFPIVPFPVLAGVIGAVFGITQGVFISLTGAMAGTMGFFYLSRYGFRDWAERKLAYYSKIKEYEELLNQNSFIAILNCRLIPVIPAPIVNIICGLSRVKAIIFFTASLVGKFPNILILSYAGLLFNNNKLYCFGIYGCYVLIIFFINFAIFYRRSANKSSFD